MVGRYSIFRQSLYTLYKNPMLLLMPLLGFMITVTTETMFVLGLYKDNSMDYFPLSNILVTALFFLGFVITYMQLIITRKIILKKGLRDINSSFTLEIIILFIIYSIYAVVLIQIGGYESAIRREHVIKPDRFSLYAVKLKNYSDIITVTPDAVNIVIISTISSLIFYSWMVATIFRYKNMNIRVLYESFCDLIAIFTNIEIRKSQLIKIAFLFFFTLTVSIVGFILTNIAVFPLASTLTLYLFQFVILNIVISIFWPFFLVCLFFIMSPSSLRL
jgi:hypothetical protein